MFVFLVVVYQANHLFRYMLFVLYSFFIPQIYCNITRNSKQSISPICNLVLIFIFFNSFFLKDIIVISICRLILPLYFFGCPYNLFHFESNFIFCLILIFWMIFQSSILISQYYFGPR